MKNLVKQLSGLLLLCAFLLSSFAVAKAAPSMKRHNHELNVKPITAKKSADRTDSPKKTSPSSRKKKLKAVAKKGAGFCPLVDEEAGFGQCMVNCITRNIPPEVLAHCANACANGEYGTCATCLGIGAATLAACAWECSSGGGSGGGYGIILP